MSRQENPALYTNSQQMAKSAARTADNKKPRFTGRQSSAGLRKHEEIMSEKIFQINSRPSTSISIDENGSIVIDQQEDNSGSTDRVWFDMEVARIVATEILRMVQKLEGK